MKKQSEESQLLDYVRSSNTAKATSSAGEFTRSSALRCWNTWAMKTNAHKKFL